MFRGILSTIYIETKKNIKLIHFSSNYFYLAIIEKKKKHVGYYSRTVEETPARQFVSDRQ